MRVIGGCIKVLQARSDIPLCQAFSAGDVDPYVTNGFAIMISLIRISNESLSQPLQWHKVKLQSLYP